MSKPDTLVVTPTLGNRDSLSKTIQTVAAIGGARVKHVLVTPSRKYSELQARFPDLEIVPEPENCKGIYMALNYALKKFASDFTYLTYINDDDYWLPDFGQLFLALDNHEHIEVAYGRTLFVDESGSIRGEQTSMPVYKSFHYLLHADIILFTQQATLMRSAVYMQHNGFDETYKLVADSAFWVQLIRSGVKFKYVNTLCAAYTIQENQLSSNKTVQTTEHKRLMNQSGRLKHPYKITLYKWLFRVYNARIYLSRVYSSKPLNPSKC